VPTAPCTDAGTLAAADFSCFVPAADANVEMRDQDTTCPQSCDRELDGKKRVPLTGKKRAESGMVEGSDAGPVPAEAEAEAKLPSSSTSESSYELSMSVPVHSRVAANDLQLEANKSLERFTFKLPPKHTPKKGAKRILTRLISLCFHFFSLRTASSTRRRLGCRRHHTSPCCPW
jgi:hypothetical protein